MGIESLQTDLSTAPYHDDFSESKGFHRVLFRPGYAVQARELTQLQTILQNQVGRFADEIFVNGTIVTGCGLNTGRAAYVKLRDRDANNQVINLSSFYESGEFVNCYAYGEQSGVTAKIMNVVSGSEAQAPDYFTIYVGYTNSGANNTASTFDPNEPLSIRRSTNDEFLFAANTIAGQRSDVFGAGLIMSCRDGHVYHKGHFIKVDSQTVVANRYNQIANCQIGFRTVETIVDSNQDSSLLDNATGASNYAAPGADRLKITAELTTANLDFIGSKDYFKVGEIVEGTLVRKEERSVYADIGDYVNEKFYETHGNYAVRPFNIRIREHLKDDTNIGKYTLAAGGDYNQFVAEVEKGVGYVGGNRIETYGSTFYNLDKATDWTTYDAAIVGQAYGNYIFCNEVAGPWDFENLGEVQLMDSFQKAISDKNYGNEGSSGNVIGTANVRGFQYDTGVSGTPEGIYRIYLFNIKMNAGKSFLDVRGVFNSGTPNSLADIILDGGVAKLYDTNLNRMVFRLGHFGTKTLKDENGNIDTQFVYRNRSDVTFGTDGTATVYLSGAHAGGTERFNDDGTPLTNIDERNVVIVCTQSTESTNHTGTITSFSGNTIVGSGANFTSDYRVGELIKIVDGANTIVERIVSIPTANDIQVANTIPYTRSGITLAHRTSYPTGYIFDTFANGSISTTTDTQMDINLGKTTSTTFNASIYYNVNRSDARQTMKVVNKEKFVHINTSTHTNTSNGPYSLGVSDVYKLHAVYLGDPATVDTTGTDVTKHFELDTGQRDSFYGTASIKKKPTSTLDLVNKGILAKISYFGRDRSSGIGFLSVDSYPIDDVFTANTNAITTRDIPKFVSPQTGSVYDLRDSIDFRPIISNTATPSTTGTAAAAPTNPVDGTTFDIDPDGSFVPTPDENFQADIQIYMSRKDRIVLTKTGKMEVIRGVPSLTPRIPDVSGTTMSLAVLNIPPYPSLSPYVAKQVSRQEYQIKLDFDNNRRYTMKDIRVLDDRIKNLEYYSSLNALETSAKNKQIFGEDGLDRFKNGFLVDNFDGHNISDTTKSSYRAAIDRNRAELRPSYSRNDVKLEPRGLDISGPGQKVVSGNLTRIGNLVMLSHTDVLYQQQPYASKLRNPVQESIFDWRGEVSLYPSIDNTPDITTLPDIQVDFNGMYESLAELADRAGVTGLSWGDWETYRTSVIGRSTRTTAMGETVTAADGYWGAYGYENVTTSYLNQTTTTLQEDQIRQGILTTVSPSTEFYNLGTFVENVAVRDYMRSRLVQFRGERLRPHTKVWPYFDSENVSAYVTPTDANFANTGIEGDALITDSSGTVHGIFRLPNDDNLKFRIGTLRFELMDIGDPTVESELLTTSAHGDYTSIPLDVTEQGTSINMMYPQYFDTTRTANRSLTRVTQDTNVTRTTEQRYNPVVVAAQADSGCGGDGDPISQTFSIPIRNSDGIFLTKIDLYFGKKSSTAPITLQIREVENGYPTYVVVPFSSKTLKPEDVNADRDSASTATSFVFDSPVYLAANKQYAMVVIPGGRNADFALWTAELGGTDFDTGAMITEQPATGMVFTSSDGVSWSEIQSEDIKYRLWRAEFTKNPATVYLENDEVEFTEIDDIVGTFNNGEKITGESIITIANNQTIAIGDVIETKASFDGMPSSNTYFANGTVRTILSSNTGIITCKVDNYGQFTIDTTNSRNVIYVGGLAAGNTTAYTANTARGFVEFFDSAHNKLHIGDSTGNFGTGFVRGQRTGASCRITDVGNIKVNTVVPKIPQILYANTYSTWGARTTSNTGIISNTYKETIVSTENDFTDEEKVVFSNTNEGLVSIVDGSNKTLILRGQIGTTDSRVSPIIDVSRTSAICLGNIINNDGTEEWKEAGNALVRYITRPVNLAEGQDAEDMKLYLTAYKPSGTEIQVFARVHNPEDEQLFDEKDYSPMTLLNPVGRYSSTINRNDFIEFEYGFGSNTAAFTSANNHALLDTSNNNVITYTDDNGSLYRTYRTFAIKIVMTSVGSHLVPLCKDMRAVALQK